jgi:hypothetical protein
MKFFEKGQRLTSEKGQIFIFVLFFDVPQVQGEVPQERKSGQDAM